MQSEWRMRHGGVISDFLGFLNERTRDYVLKGGTALMSCYGLDRFSEDIDLDSTNKEAIKSIIPAFCDQMGYSYRTAKDTDTVKRFFIHYGLEGHPLKIEISYRNRELKPDDICTLQGITVYNINRIASMKCGAYLGRDKIRDLYDITFILKTYKDELSPDVLAMASDALQQKGLEQFDYVIATQNDDLIDKDKLADDFLEVMDDLGLIVDADDDDDIDYGLDGGIE